MRHVALLRAVNLGPHNKVSMAELRALAESLGLRDAKTLLQSGNLVFDCTGAPARLEQRLAAETAKALGVETEYFVRTAPEWSAIIAGNPFPAEARRDPGHLILLCCKGTVAPAAVQELQAAIKGREVVRGRGRELYAVYPDGVGRSRLSVALIERKLGARVTGRNWNTVLKLGSLLG